MSTDFGCIVVGHTEDFEGDLEAICKALNTFEGWNNDGLEFVFHAGAITMAPCEYVTVIPEFLVGHYVDDATTILKRPDEIADDELDGDTFVETAEYELEDICVAVSPHINAGGLIITATTAYNGNSVTFGQLQIFADGTAERTFNFSTVNHPTRIRHDAFPET